MHNKECFGIFDLLNVIVSPNQSSYYNSTINYLSTLLDFQERGLSNKFIYNQLKNSKIKEEIILRFENKVKEAKAISNVLGISIIATFNFFAEAKGFLKIPDYINVTIPLLTEIVMDAIYKSEYEKIFQGLLEEDKDDTNFLGFNNDDEYQSISDLEDRIENLEESRFGIGT